MCIEVPVMAKKKRSAFVPRLLLHTAMAAVVPACALACSSSSDTSPSADTGTKDTGGFGVADVSYGVAQDAYVRDTGTRDSFFAVADAGYGDSATDSTEETTDGDAGAPDVFGVAAVAYPAYETGAPG